MGGSGEVISGFSRLISPRLGRGELVFCAGLHGLRLGRSLLPAYLRRRIQSTAALKSSAIQSGCVFPSAIVCSP